MQKLKFGKDYLSNIKTYPFPSEDISQDLKRDPMYFLSCANAIISKYVNNRCAIPYERTSGQRSFEELRSYRNGNNNPNKYKNFLAGQADPQTGRRRSTLNISWEVLKILPQKMDVVKGYLQKINYDVVTHATDYNALISKKTMVSMAKMLADSRLGSMTKEINTLVGHEMIKTPEPSERPGGMAFNSPQDVDVASHVGIFYLEQEAALQNLLGKTKDESSLDGVMDLWNEDLMTCGHAGSFVNTNQNTSMVTVDYVDIDTAIFPYSKYDDYRDITWAGNVRQMTIAQLRKELNLSETQLVEIARKYSSDSYGNMPNNFYQNAYNSRNDQFGMNMMDQVLVDVIDCRWYGQKSVNMTSIVRDKEKSTALNIVDDNYRLSDKAKNKGKELYQYKNQTIYKCKMVLGTSYIFDYGEDNDISYKKDINGNRWPIFPYRFSRCLSLVERCIGFVDDANLANLKLRVARRKMPAPPNMQIDKAALENMQIGGTKYKPAELMQLLQDEGFLITDSKNQWGTTNSQGAAIRPIATDVIGQLQAWWDDMGRCIDMIEKVTGINDVFSAQTPQRETGLGVSNLLVQGTQNALTPLVKAREYLYESSMKAAGGKWQIVATYLPKEQRERLSINSALEMVKVGSDLNDYDFSISIEPGYSQNEKDQLMADLLNMKAASRQGGQKSLSEADFLIAEALIRSGKMVQAQLYVAQAIDRSKKEAQEEQMQMIQANGQQQQQSIANKAQADQQLMATEAQLDTQQQLIIQKAKTQGDIQVQIVKAQAEQAKIRLDAAYGRKSA